MSIHSVSNPPLDGVHPDIDLSQSMHLFRKVEWANPPVNQCRTQIQRENLDRHSIQGGLYQKVGNSVTWSRYVVLGYYIFDDCFQFETQWNKLRKNLVTVQINLVLVGSTRNKFRVLSEFLKSVWLDELAVC
ncbi:hypothetical protein MHU86_2011 [Fragilaria crotonensis]|nr:hypothetical protein MHU86_2011 [Fragilaria crotonensis]